MTRLAALALAIAFAAPAAAELGGRVKAFGILGLLPEEDVLRQTEGTPSRDANLDVRLKWRLERGAWRVIVDHETVFVSGDTFAAGGIARTMLDRTPEDDDTRLMDLSWTLDDGSRHRLTHRFDRLALQYRRGRWGVTVGRQAVTWGSGRVFQPLDLFNPFAPTAVDRDYKPGDDLLLVDRLLAGGGDVQVLAVIRRDDQGDVTGDASSIGAKWHTFAGRTELELAAGRHYGDRFAGFSLRVPIGGALARTDIVATDVNGDWKVSTVINADYSFEALSRNVYVFGEYFHNGFGVDELDVTALPEPLSRRLERGELFNLMRDYTAVGAQIQWHPLWMQSATLITNLHDSSSLVQVQVGYDPGDAQRLEAGFVMPLGAPGDEFGGVELAPGLTTGGGTQLYLRWAYYW